MNEFQENALDDITAERDRQDNQWGKQNHHPAYWLAILGKQVGQLGEAVLDREWFADEAKASLQIRSEAVQVAAVALALIECIDEGEMPTGLVTAKPADPRQLARALGRGDESIHGRVPVAPPLQHRGYEDHTLPPGSEPC